MGRTEHDDGRGGGEDGDGEKKRVELSVSQVAGAGAATLAAATAASYLNVYGTVVGAAVMAALSTLASPFLQQLFSRGGDQARQFAGKAAGRAGPTGTGSRRVGAHPLDPPGTGPVPGLAPTGPLPGLPEDLDATRTMALPVLGPGGAADHRAGADGGARPARDRGREGPARRGWRAYAVTAAAVFALVMLVILLFELFTGRSLTAWTQGQEEHTSPTLLGGTSAPPAQEEDGTGDAPADTGPDGLREDGTGEGTREPEDGTTDPATPDPGTGPPAVDDGATDPAPPGEEGTTGPGEGPTTDPGTGGEDPGGAGGAPPGGTQDTAPEAPAG